MNRSRYDTNHRRRRRLSQDQKKALARKLSLAVMIVLAIATVVMLTLLFIRNREAKKTIQALFTPDWQTALVETDVPSPSPAMTVARPSGTILATKVGFYDEVQGYQLYDPSGADYPRWVLSASDEKPNPIILNQAAELQDGLAIHTFGDVGAMFSVFALNFDPNAPENNQLYTFGASNLTISASQGVTDIALYEGAIFLRMASRADLAEIAFPNHGNAAARVIGGSALLTLDAETISFWCISEECQLDFYDQTLRLRENQLRVYQRFADFVGEAEEYGTSPERQEEYALWNRKCDLCMPLGLMDDSPVPDPVYTPQPTYYFPAEPTESPAKTPTPTATKPATPTQYTLTVRTEGQGTVSPNGGSYDAGARVTLSAKAADGWEFSGWSGDASGTSSTVTLTITKNMTVKATFTKKAPVMYTLTATAGDGGSVSLNPSGGSYEAGTQVTLTASPNEGYQFNGWSGDASGFSNPLTITMDGNKTITANFKIKSTAMYRLTVSVTPSEGGSVSLSPAGGYYEAGTEVTLTASPNEGYQFAGWGGAASGTSNPITITMDGNKSINANFTRRTPTRYTLTVTAGDGGSVSLNPAGGSYEAGTHVTLTASPKSGYQFNGWSGDASGFSNPLIITMDGNKTITANFTIKPPTMYRLTVSVTPSGGGFVSLSPAGGYYEAGTEVTLTASPNEGYQFFGWGGAASGSGNPLTLIMDGNKSINANFEGMPTKQEMTARVEDDGQSLVHSARYFARFVKNNRGENE